MYDNTFDSAMLHINDQSDQTTARYVNPRAITLPPGYTIEVFAEGLDAPSAITFNSEGEMLIGESGYISGKTDVLKLRNGNFEVVAEDFEAPLTGICYHDQNIYVSHLGKVTKVKPDGSKQIIINGLPKHGDYWNSNVAFGIDNKMYIGQGTATNSGVVGTDNKWVLDYPFLCDYPGSYVLLNGQNYETQNLFTTNGEKILTGAFSPYGVPNMPFEVRKGITRASGSILRANPDGTDLELVVWGLRYPVHLKYDRFNRLFASNQSFEIRGSRPIANAPNEFQLILPGQWYGWPDYAGGEAVTSDRFTPEGGKQPELLLLNHPSIPPHPFAVFPSNSYISGFDFCNQSNFGVVGDAYIAEFGAGGRIVPGVTTPYIGIGHRISRIDMNTGGVTTFAMNKSGFPTSVSQEGGFDRPTDVAFGPDGALYIVDLGMNVATDFSEYVPNTGVIWKVTRTR